MSKKILIILYYYHPYVSGISVYAKRLSEGLVKAGFSVTILTTRFNKELPEKEDIGGVEVVRCPVLFRLSKGVISPSLLFRSIMMGRKYDIINMHLPFSESGLIALFNKKNKLITTYQCDINLGSGVLVSIIEKASLFLMNIALWRSKKIITLSKDYFSRSKFRRYLYKSVEIHPPIDVGRFHKRKDFHNLQKRLNLKHGQFIIGFAGRIVYEKGISYLLEAIKYLDIPKYKIVIAGDYKNIAGGSIKNELDAITLKHKDKIVFTGFLNDDDLVKFYSMINVLVLPSIDPLEAFGMVQVEAMCCGTPVVASDLPGVRSVIKKTKFGYISKPKNPVDIAEKIMSIYNKKIPKNNFNKNDWGTEATVFKYRKIFLESLR